MTVRELIEKLQAFPPDTRVVTHGFDESNLDDVETVELVRVVFCDNLQPCHVGRHLRAEGCTTEEYRRHAIRDRKAPQPVEAVEIGF